MWSWEASDLEHRSDTLMEGARSTVFVLEDGRQLDRPHALHSDIAKRGDGRFSHWGKRVYFAPRGNRDPRRNPERLALFVPAGGSGKSGRASASSAAAAPRAPSSRSSPLAVLRARYPGVRGAVSVLLRRNRLARRLQPLLDRREEGVLATLQTPGDFPFRISRPVARRVLMGSGALHGGGAERQIVNAIEGLRARGVDDVHLLVQFLDPGDSNAFYLDKAAKAAKSIVRPADRDYGSHPWMLQHGAFRSVVSDGLASQVLCSAETIAGLSPEVVHCSLDWPNVVIGMAAVLAGVPHVFLSGRNLSPRHFWFFRCFMYPCYRALAAHPAVRLLNNSEAGRDDYAGWLRLPREKIRVLRNGLQPEDFVPAGDGDRTAARRQLGLPADAKVVAGAFRLSSEKRPLLWLEAAARIKATLPDAVFLHCGAGPMQARFEARAHRLGLGGSVRLLGARKDIQTVLAAADVVLQTSLQEGTPNTLIEAQAMGVPVVTTPACGAREAVAHSVTGTVVHDDRAATLSAAVLAILSDAAMAGRMRQSGPAFVESRFGFQRMIDDTLGAFAAAGVAWAAEHMQPTTCPAART
jgi:glycosyltransferase involved in cell wall biosynthesis